MLNPFDSLPCAVSGVSQVKQLARHRCILTSIGHSQPTEPIQYNWDNNIRAGVCLFQYTLAGAGGFRNGDTGITTALTPGLGFLVPFPSNTYYWLPADTHWEFVYACMSGDAVYHHVRELTRRHGYLYELSPTGKAIEILRDLFAAVSAGRPPSEFSISARLYRFLMELYDAGQPAAADLPTEVARAKNYVDEHYHVIDMGVDALARIAGYSKYHFSRVFRRHLGVSPHEYLLQVRLQRAQELLISTALPVKEIGQMVGFGDYAYFCNTFRRRIGLTPGALRRQRQRF